MITSRDIIISLVGLAVGAMLPFIAITNNHNQDFVNHSDNRYVQTEDSHLRNTHRALSQVMFDPKSVHQKNNGNSPNLPYSQWLNNYNGWKNVWIYTGTDIKYVIPMVPVSRYSQSGQDVTVSLLFPNGGGFYIDMAANSPVQLSNTLLLEQSHGWNGLCIEPNSVHWYGLANRRCEVIGAFISDELDSKIEVVFGPANEEKGHTTGGIVNDAILDNKNQPKAARSIRFATTFSDVLTKFMVAPIIDYLSLDVEGAEYFVMLAFPFDRYVINVLTVERPPADLVKLLRNNSYMYKGEHGDFGDEVWIHASFEERYHEVFPRGSLSNEPNDSMLWVRKTE